MKRVNVLFTYGDRKKRAKRESINRVRVYGIIYRFLSSLDICVTNAFPLL